MIMVPDLAELSRSEGIGRHTALVTLDRIDDYLSRFPPRREWDQVLVRHCQCCGERPAAVEYRGIVRCAKHVGRNPCAIVGCKRSTKASENWSGNDLWLCGQHWRLGCPPRSAQRRVYQRFFRRAERYGWNDASSSAFWRTWRRILAVARVRAAGDIDETEINRLMGWDKAA